MTVCTAVINQKEGAIVYASDRMVTSGYPPVEFEHPIPKLIKITAYCVVLSAGNALLKQGLCQHVQEQIADKTLTIKEIVAVMTSLYQEARLNRAEELLLKNRGLSLQVFWKEGINCLPHALICRNTKGSSAI
jgi:hypothetical protein